MHATIDIGTNSVLLLIADPRSDGSVRVECDLTHVTRLGQGLTSTGVISTAAADRTMQTLRDYKELCEKHGVRSIAAIGTAALRNATNAAEFVARAKNDLGLEIEVISAEREARLTYEASAHDFGTSIEVIDIGGGSTELIAQRRDPKGELPGLNILSMPVGSVSLTEKYLKSDPVTHGEMHELRSALHKVFQAWVEPIKYARPNDLTFVATAGTATTLMSMHLRLEHYSADAVHGGRMKISEMRDIIDKITPMTIAARKGLTGLMPERADVILAGAELLHDAMSFLGYAEVTISDRGVKWGLFYEKFCNSSPFVRGS